MKNLVELIELYASYGVHEDALKIMQGLYDMRWRDEYLLNLNLESVQEMGGNREDSKDLLQIALFHAAFSGCGPKPLRLLKAIALNKAEGMTYDLESMQLLIELNWINTSCDMGPAARAYVQSMTTRPEKRAILGGAT